jgi:hypothetical protein
MKKLLAIVLSVCICIAWIKDEPVRPERFVGKWFVTDYKVDGITDPDGLAEFDSTTYILRADGTFTFCRVWYKRSADTTTVCGTWEYYEKKTQLHFHWTNPRRKKPERWPLISGDATSMVTGLPNREIHWQKAP